MEALTQVREKGRESINAANAPQMATTTLDESGCCEFCGSYHSHVSQLTCKW